MNSILDILLAFNKLDPAATQLMLDANGRLYCYDSSGESLPLALTDKECDILIKEPMAADMFEAMKVYDLITLMREEFNKVVAFAIKQGINADNFLELWQHGDWDAIRNEWPEFYK